jgi:hypothetical protein
MLIDPRLQMSDEVEGLIWDAVASMSGMPGPFMTSVFAEPLTVEIRGDDLWVRAATGDEVTELLTAGGYEDDGLDWPGDPADPTGREVTWQERADSPAYVEPTYRVWSGEVLLESGGAVAGPFYVHEQAARAWAFSTAIGMPAADVEAQVVPYAVVGRFASGLLRGGDNEARRLMRRFWVSPLRSWGQPYPVSLPPYRLLAP